MSLASLITAIRSRRRLGWLAAMLILIVVAFGPLLVSRLLSNVGLVLLNRSLAQHGVTLDGSLADSNLMQAEQWLRTATEVDPGNRGAWRGLGYLYWATSHVSDALAAWRKVGTMSDEFVARGEVLRTVQPEEAEAWLHRALELDPQSCAAHMQLGLLYRERDQPVDAAREYAACVMVVPESLEAQTGLCNAWVSAGEPDRALAAYQAAPSLLQEQAPMLACAGVAYWSKQNYVDAATYMERASSLVPDDGRYHQWLSLIYTRLGFYEKALAQSLIAIELDPRRTDFWRQFGAVYLALGHRDEAISAYRMALAIDPDDEAARRALETLGVTSP
ncbi:MAG TPA: tetratricopeptide repeat protein [Anaerolineae bacterium]|nr:tetratricopeptide repeat protein [Anaerolineae bacterium]